jgi:hypothetical protein
MQKRLMRIGMLVVVGLSAFSCAGTPTATRASLPTILPPTLPGDVLVVYHKQGGIAGVDDTLTVHQGGLLELDTRAGNPKSLLVNEPVVQPLRRMLEQTEFGELKPLYEAQGADLFIYRITARDAGGQIKTVTATDGATMPDYLGILLGQLEQLREIVAKNG